MHGTLSKLEQRRAGEVLQEMDKAKGAVLNGRHKDGTPRRFEPRSAEEKPPTYAEMGIDTALLRFWGLKRWKLTRKQAHLMKPKSMPCLPT